MNTPSIILFAILVAAQGYTFWRISKLMTVNESLANTVTFCRNSIDRMAAAIDTLPAQITRVVQDAIAKANAAGGSVSDDELIAAIQALTEDSKRLLANADSVPIYFDQQVSVGNTNPVA